MPVYMLKAFSRFRRKERITAAMLLKAVEDAMSGLIEADLGGGIIKQRVARAGQGKSGGYRTLIAFRQGERAVFLYGFAKSERPNIDPDELEAWRRIGRTYLGLDDRQVRSAVVAGELMEVRDEPESQR